MEVGYTAQMQLHQHYLAEHLLKEKPKLLFIMQLPASSSLLPLSASSMTIIFGCTNVGKLSESCSQEGWMLTQACSAATGISQPLVATAGHGLGATCEPPASPGKVTNNHVVSARETEAQL